MDTEFCKYCQAFIGNRESHCPSCGKETRYGEKERVKLIFAIIAALVILFYFLPRAVISQHLPISTPTATQTIVVATATKTAIPSPTVQSVFPKPQGAGWIAQTYTSGVYVKGGNGCLLFDSSVSFCNGETVEVFVTTGYWHIIWITESGDIFKKVITPGEIVQIVIPDGATKIGFGNQR